MKKIIALLLALVMTIAMAACTPAANNNETTTAPVVTEVQNTEPSTAFETEVAE